MSWARAWACARVLLDTSCLFVSVVALIDVWLYRSFSLPFHAYVNFLLLRRKVRASDVMPFFDDYPPIDGQMSAEEAQAHLKAAARKSGGLEDGA